MYMMISRLLVMIAVFSAVGLGQMPPVEPGAVIDFYYSRIRAARLDARHVAGGGVHLLTGSSGAAAYAVQARQRSDGMTETDIVVNGG